MSLFCLIPVILDNGDPTQLSDLTKLSVDAIGLDFPLGFSKAYANKVMMPGLVCSTGFLCQLFDLGSTCLVTFFLSSQELLLGRTTLRLSDGPSSDSAVGGFSEFLNTTSSQECLLTPDDSGAEYSWPGRPSSVRMVAEQVQVPS